MTRRELLLGLPGLGLAARLPTVAAARNLPNILYILCDDLGWSDSTLYGTTKLYETPNIEKLAARGVLFTQAYSAGPMCSPTRGSIMSGLWPERTGLTEANGHVEEVRLKAEPRASSAPWQRYVLPLPATRMDTAYYTMGKAFRDAGYRTAHFGKWHLGREPYDPLHQGFTSDIPHSYQCCQPGRYLAPWKWAEGVTYDTGSPGEYVDDRMANEAIRFMTENRNETFYCNVWFYATHGGPQTTPELREKYRKKIETLPADYPQRNPETAGLVELLDRAVGKLMRAVDDLGIADRTIIVFFSDNGGWCWPSGQPMPMTSNAPLRSGKSSVYEGGTRVPLAFIWPGRTKPGSRTDAIFNSLDSYPTLLAMAGLKPKPGVKLDGINQVPAILDKGAPRDTNFCFVPYPGRDYAGPGAWVRKGDWKLIRFFCGNPDQSDRFELYNLRADIGETKDLAKQQPRILAELSALLEKHFEQTHAVLPIKNPKYDPKAKPPQQTAMLLSPE